jgi:hypothetical protein
MENQFAKIMKKRSDEELLEITSRLRNDYQPDAVKAAEEELKSRGLSNEQFEKIQNDVNIKAEKEDSLSYKSLTFAQKALFLIFSIGLIPMLIAIKYERKGEIRKYKEAWRFMKIGLTIYMIIILIRVCVILVNG